MSNISSQKLPQNQEEQDQQNQQQKHRQNEPSKTPCLVIIMIGYLYFAQGFILSIASTMPYVYPKLPDYSILSLFSMSSLPFSFKFITAPIVQKYSFINYGKRKTWIISAQLLTLIMIFLCSFFTDISQASTFALLAIFIYLGLSIQDIALDGLSLKQFKSPRIMSMVQSSCVSTGLIIGSFVFLKGTSLQFAESIGLQNPITSMKTILVSLSIFMLVPAILIHFFFKQTFAPNELKTTHESIWKVYSLYKYYFKLDYRFCRLAIFVLIYRQGFHFFFAGYDYELINAGFSRNTMNTMDNILSIIVTLITFLIGAKANYFGYKRSFLFELSATLLVCLYVWVFFPLEVLPIVIISFFMGILSRWNSLLSTIISGDFPDIGVSGMIYTMSASAVNFGQNTFIHKAILKKVPWKTMSIIGLGIQLCLTIFFVPFMIKLINKGRTDIQISPQNQQNKEILQNKQKQKTISPNL